MNEVKITLEVTRTDAEKLSDTIIARELIRRGQIDAEGRAEFWEMEAALHRSAGDELDERIEALKARIAH